MWVEMHHFLEEKYLILTLECLKMLDKIDDDHIGAVVPPTNSLLL